MTVAPSSKPASTGAVLDPFRHRGEYGVDGDFTHLPAAVHALGAGAFGLAIAGAGVRSIARGRPGRGAAVAAIGGLVLGTAAVYGHATRVGKFSVWAELLTDLGLRGDERLLDLGCGRGAVLLTAAKLLPRGRAVGIDLWRPNQTGNSMAATRRNAQLEGVADRVEVETGDVTRLPFADASFDVIVSNLVIHNIHPRAGRRSAIEEAVRVLRPGGRLVIADLLFTGEYVEWLRGLGLNQVERRGAGPRMWYGGPWLSVHVVSAAR